MKLLFDQNLSPRLVRALADLHPGSTHVREVGLKAADDEIVWSYAANNGFAIISKDGDFRQMSFLYGHPPKVIWIKRGNCSTSKVEEILRTNHSHLLEFEADKDTSLLVLE